MQKFSFSSVLIYLVCFCSGSWSAVVMLLAASWKMCFCWAHQQAPWPFAWVGLVEGRHGWNYKLQRENYTHFAVKGDVNECIALMGT